MTGPRSGVPPPKEAAAPARTRAADQGNGSNENYRDNNTDEADSLLKKASAVMPSGELFEFLPEHPGWCCRIGDQADRFIDERRIYARIGLSAGPIKLPSLDRKRLEFVYQLAGCRRRGAEIGPVYPAATHASTDEARKALADAFDDVLADTLGYHTTTTRMTA